MRLCGCGSAQMRDAANGLVDPLNDLESGARSHRSVSALARLGAREPQRIALSRRVRTRRGGATTGRRRLRSRAELGRRAGSRASSSVVSRRRRQARLDWRSDSLHCAPTIAVVMGPQESNAGRHSRVAPELSAPVSAPELAQRE